MIKIKNITKTYAKAAVKAVDDMTLTINPGEAFGFIGPNGAGKTTTIKLLTGILQPDSGEIIINQKNIASEPIAVKQSIGYVPDTGALYEKLSGLEYLSFMADMYNVPQAKRDKLIPDYLHKYSLFDAARDQIRSYSRGMRQKLTIIGALLHQPKVLILDEPLVGLDPRASHILKQEIREHCDAGNTVFFSTHVLEVAERLCDRIGIISGGRLIATGTLEELRSEKSDTTLEQVFLNLTQSGEAEGWN